jgi:hypothetical protein
MRGWWSARREVTEMQIMAEVELPASRVPRRRLRVRGTAVAMVLAAYGRLF